MWSFTEHDIQCLAIGAGILGCGGGGNPSVAQLLATQAIREGRQISVLNPFRLVFPWELPVACLPLLSTIGRVAPGTQGRVVPVAFMGAPIILVEKLVNGQEIPVALKAIQQVLASGMYSGDKGDGREGIGEIKVSPRPDQEGIWMAEGYESVDVSNVPLVSVLVQMVWSCVLCLVFLCCVGLLSNSSGAS